MNNKIGFSPAFTSQVLTLNLENADEIQEKRLTDPKIVQELDTLARNRHDNTVIIQPNPLSEDIFIRVCEEINGNKCMAETILSPEDSIKDVYDRLRGSFTQDKKISYSPDHPLYNYLA